MISDQGFCISIPNPYSSVKIATTISNANSKSQCCTQAGLFEAALQYFTSSQTFSHFLRHVKGFLHTMQIRWGRSCFLFLNIDFLRTLFSFSFTQLIKGGSEALSQFLLDSADIYLFCQFTQHRYYIRLI